ncbi:hypothetical protein PVAND_002955 [Polypedilum vanderplanki]|uniref:Amine oxidase domain-containing protein n=1 Tax=Polypedilum vanderplanki TaxID=319348 RepID=A0A9J6BT04_POLVA|nr:hypothetical protein PVAND_002955 [Polypedilum vanderplanki]
MKVIIIGAGAAGVAAASRLFQSGVTDFKILEAENRIGGRIHTMKFGNAMIDLGAQWCHGHNIVYDLVGKENLEEAIMDFRKMTYSNGSKELIDFRVCSFLFQLLFKIEENIKSKNGNESVENYFTRIYYEELQKLDYKNKALAKEILDNFLKRESCYCASNNMNEISIDNFNKYKDCDGPTWLSYKGVGLKRILDLLTRYEFSLDNKVLFNKRVINIDYSNDGKITVKCADGSEFLCDHVICTVSLGVLKLNHLKLFTPQLPANKVKALNALKFGAIGKVFIEFERQFWSDDWLGLTLLWNEGNIKKIKGKYDWLDAIYCIYNFKYYPNILIAFMGGNKVEIVEKLSTEKIKEGIEFVMKNFLPDEIKSTQIVNVKQTTWKTNENFLGTYSYHAIENVCMKSLQEPLFDKQKKIKVAFAGEAFHEDYFSTVHGAVETGYRAADEIAKQICKSKL